MKLIVTLLAVTMLLSFQYSDNSKQSNITSDGKLNLFCPDPPSFSETVKTVSDEKGTNSGTDKIDQDWYSKAMEQIEKEEYNISYSEELGEYQSPNRANNIRFIYHKDGFTAKTRTNMIPKFDVNDKTLKEEEKEYETIDEWDIQFRIKNEELRIEENKLQAAGNKAWIENEKIRVDYTNTKEGMRQDFIIKQKPEGEGKLRLDLTADTKLKMIVGADALMFKDKNGIDKMKYSSLKVWDANGRELRAYFEKSEKLQITNDKLQIKNKSHNSDNINICNLKSDICNSFSIVVNDEEAVYPITIDPLSTSPDWTAESDQASAQFGYSVSTAGDVNGDGYSDVIVGARFYDNGQTNEGRAFVYHGSPSGLSALANWTAEGDQANAYFGWSVSTAGDVNGDGYSDVIVGAPYFIADYIRGMARVYYGSPSGLLQGNFLYLVDESKVSWIFFGVSVSTAGDVNGDGYSDVIVGAPGYMNDYNPSNGRVFVYHGSASGLSRTDTVSLKAPYNPGDLYFGSSVSTAGDVNGDGYSDVIVGTRNSAPDWAFAFYGSASGLSATANWTYNQIRDSEFGISVSTAGDVNGDGYSDVIVGEAEDFGFPGRAFAFYGSASGLSSTANWTAESNQADARFGISVSTAGDVNGDGYSDVIVGGPYYDDGETDEGKAIVYYGSGAGLSATANWTAESDQASAQFGFSVSTAGDVNGDGYSDVIVGAYAYDNGQTDEGRAFVYHGSSAGLSATANWTAESDQANAEFGFSVSTAGDVNGDGYSDVIVGALLYDNGQTDEGRAFVYLGSATGLSATPNWTAESDQAGANFGYSVSMAGDVNGDGYSDVIIGALVYDNGQTDEGRTFVYHGSASGLSATPNWTAESDQANALFGWSVSTAGDVNGDGYSDVIVGAYYFDNGQLDEGRAFVYHGSALGLSATANWTAESDQASAFFGSSVSTAGDVNGDGYSDVIVGAIYFDNGQTDEGRAYVYHGSALGLSPAANWIAESDQAEAYFGWSVSTAGDVNGDGYSDVIVGARFFDNGQSNEGRAYVYHGSASGLPVTANWTAESDQAEALFGSSVSTAGNVNGDGYSDVIIGAPYFDYGQTNEGRAFVYHGSASGLTEAANWTAENDQSFAEFGNSVSTAGDVNGDGYSDVIVGADYFDNGETDEGRAFVYYGNGSTGLRSTVQQYKPGTGNVVSSGSLTGTNGQVRLNTFGRSPFGRADGKIVYEYKENGVPFSGTNSTSFSGSGTNTDLGITGVQLNNDVSGLLSDKVYKWRARVQYSPVNNPYQKYGPWKYYNNYIPTPLGNFRARDGQTLKQLDLTMLIQGFYDAGANSMTGDTVKVYLRNSSSPYAVVDSAKAFVNSSGQGTFTFSNAVDGTPYYLEVVHRNSIETWSKTTQQFTASALSYDFTNANTQAFGDNMANIDASPVRYGIYSGDENQDGAVNLADIVNVNNNATAFINGYVSSDMNGDNLTDLADVVITYNNSVLFVAKIIP